MSYEKDFVIMLCKGLTSKIGEIFMKPMMNKKVALLRKGSSKKTSTRTSKKVKELMEKVRFESKWHQIYKLKGEEKAKAYSMEGEYGQKSTLVHPTLGWGFVLKRKDKRIEVLFRSGIKSLVCKQSF